MSTGDTEKAGQKRTRDSQSLPSKHLRRVTPNMWNYTSEHLDRDWDEVLRLFERDGFIDRADGVQTREVTPYEMERFYKGIKGHIIK